MEKWQLVLVLLLIFLYVMIIIICHHLENVKVNRSPQIVIVGESKRKNKAVQRKIWKQQEKKRQQPLKMYMEYHRYHLSRQRKRW